MKDSINLRTGHRLRAVSSPAGTSATHVPRAGSLDPRYVFLLPNPFSVSPKIYIMFFISTSTGHSFALNKKSLRSSNSPISELKEPTFFCTSFRILLNPVKPQTQKDTRQAQVVQTMDSAIRRINHYSLDNSIGFAGGYPLDSDLSGG